MTWLLVEWANVWTAAPAVARLSDSSGGCAGNMWLNTDELGFHSQLAFNTVIYIKSPYI